MSSFDYDLFVIGAGSGGVRLARMSAAMGAKVAIAEDRYLGGTCVNVGCVPKKLLVYAAHVSEELEDAKGYGWSAASAYTFDWPTLIRNKNKEIQRLNGIYKNLLEASGAQIISGRARFIDRHTLRVNDQTYTAERIAIATGSWPFVPEFEGSELAITSNELFFLEDLPSSAVVLGGGYIAVEMAGILNGLGVQTKLVYRGELFLRGFDDEVRQFVKTELQKKGITLQFNDNISSLTRTESGQLRVRYQSDTEELTGLVLVATGRNAHTQDLGLERLDLALTPSGHIQVNQEFETSVPGIYALGDVTGGIQLTPVALAEGMYLAQKLFGAQPPLAVDYQNIATAVFCQPTIATIGLTEQQARQKYPEISVFVSTFKPMKFTLAGRDERCLMKMLVDKASDKVVGIHMVGPEAGEIIQGLAIALKAGATKSHFDQTIGIHPTAAEEFVTMRQARV